jgi:murein DD-endopeptidase MepM/ murein hydrolase activator NlpD
MKARSVTVFFGGFAAGVLFMTVLLRQAGTLGVIKAAAASHSFEAPHAVSNPLPDASASKAPAPLLNLPAAQAEAHSRNQLPSDSPSSFPRGLLIPVSGVSSSSLVDNFNEIHNGHRHEALDIMAARGTPVVAVDEGNVVKLFNSTPGGLTVYQFDDAQIWCFYYAHLDRYAQGLKEGTLLRKGDILGSVGSSGNASANAPHLHFTIFRLGPGKRWWQGTAIDAYPLLTGESSVGGWADNGELGGGNRTIMP